VIEQNKTMPTLTIDGHTIECAEGRTILEAADTAGVYIPRLCHHPDLPPVRDVIWADSIHQGDTIITGEKAGNHAGEVAHCNLCLVEVEGQTEPVNSCITSVEDGMVVRTDTTEVIGRRKKALARILADHPHACLTCAQKEGCSRTDCSTNVPVDERCCILLGRCELGKVSDHIGIPGDTPKYVPQHHAVIKDDLLFDRDYNLCIGCLRCVRICRDVREIDILGAVWKENRAWVGTKNSGGLKEAECRFCGACVEVCPTGALLDKESAAAVRRDAPLPCVGNCPAGIDIPHYLRLIALERDREAMEVIRSRVPFPGILGYICFHPCEDVCRRGDIDQAVAICALKRYVADNVSENDFLLSRKQPDTGKKIAIIGSGPTGLTAAYYLGIAGHAVDIFDRAAKPGGMLRHGIPDYRLPPEVLDRELKILEKIGIHFNLNHLIDSGFGISELKNQGFDTVLLAAGTSASKKLPVENADLGGVYLGLEFLQSAKLAREPRLEGNVVVIGGGNVAIDAAMTAFRLGADDVHLVCLESRDEMPAHGWEITQAEEEGVQIHPSWGPIRFTSDNGRVSGVELKRCTRVFDDSGRFDPQYDENETNHIPADFVIVTIGQEVDRDLFDGVDGVQRGPGGTLKADNDFAVGIDGVFAAGDVVRGPSSVIQAIADGRQVAEVIDRYLGGDGNFDVVVDPARADNPKLSTPSETIKRPRQAPNTANPNKRKSGFGLIEETFPEQTARLEAERCLLCHLRQTITPVLLPPEPWLPLDQENVESVPQTEGVFQLLNAEKKVIRICGTMNLRQDLAECLDNSGDASFFIWEEDPMYTKRESELIQQYLQEHGELPGGAGGDDDLDDLF